MHETVVGQRRIAIPGFGLRREAREDAIAILYETEIAGRDIREALSHRAIPLSDYASGLIEGINRDLVDIDHVLSRHLVGWSVERLAVVDRIIARMGVWELMNCPDVPTGVVLSEVVKLATKYCGQESPRFLNGVLDAIATSVRGDGVDRDTYRSDDSASVSDSRSSEFSPQSQTAYRTGPEPEKE